MQAGTEYTYGQIFVYIQGDQKVSLHLMITIQKSGALSLFITLYNRVQFLSKLQNLDSDRPQHDRPTARVNAQQYSPLTFVLLRSYSRKEKFGMLQKKVIISVLFFSLF